MKILYLNHICWEWIFQRPQILALLLGKEHDCTVLNKKFFLGKTAARENERPISEKIVWQLPKETSFGLIRKVNEYLYGLAVRKYLKLADTVWVCHPSLYKYVPLDFKGKVIYDCMDNHMAMATEETREIIGELETRLAARADIIFVTSQRLKDVVPGMRNAVIVRNGYRSAVAAHAIKKAAVKQYYQVGYFGTIASWFDFDLLQASLDAKIPVTYHLLGPTEAGIKKNTDKFVFEGIVEHSKLGSYVKDYDALIMPFQLNELILAVDPVKLYEYIQFGKCIISVWYPELERFKPFVYFYENEAEYLELMEKLTKEGFPPKYSEQDRSTFLKENSWEARYALIEEQLKKVLPK